MNTPITIETHIEAPIEKIWSSWTEPEHITKWAFASDDWCAPWAKNDVRVGGDFSTRMESKDGKTGFEFGGTYTVVEPLKKLEYIMADGRKVSIDFIKEESGYKIVETFDPEDENPIEMQKNGWQAILDNFKKHVTEQ